MDESGAWNDLHARHVVEAFNYQLAYGNHGACTNGTDGSISRMCRAEANHHHHIAGVYLGQYAQESACREDHRRAANGPKVIGIVVWRRLENLSASALRPCLGSAPPYFKAWKKTGCRDGVAGRVAIQQTVVAV